VSAKLRTQEISMERVRPWLTIEQAAQELGIAISLCRRLITHGELESRSFGTKVICIRSSVVAVGAGREQGTAGR
jgi:hypothetical protein